MVMAAGHEFGADEILPCCLVPDITESYELAGSRQALAMKPAFNTFPKPSGQRLHLFI